MRTAGHKSRYNLGARWRREAKFNYHLCCRKATALSITALSQAATQEHGKTSSVKADLLELQQMYNIEDTVLDSYEGRGHLGVQASTAEDEGSTPGPTARW